MGMALHPPNAIPEPSIGQQSHSYGHGPTTGCIPICHPHVCHFCGASMDNLGTHGLHCSRSIDRYSCHSAVNEVIQRALASAKIAAHLEPTGICTADGKQLDGDIVLHHLLQWIAVVVQRGNAAAMLGTSSVSGELSVPF